MHHTGNKLHIASIYFLLCLSLTVVPIDGRTEDAPNQVGFGAVAAMSAEDLADFRGADYDVTTVVQSNQQLNQTVHGGSIEAGKIMNGEINIGSLENFNGIGLLVSNTGNNSAVNAALGVTFHLE
jgi:hypothetical protein